MAESRKSSQADAYMESMKAYQKTYDFLLYLYPILSQFPKFEKFALQSQIKTAVFEMLKSVIRFRKTGTKSHIYNADVELQFIKTLIRLSYDLQYPAMSKHRYEVLSRKMTELGCIIGGIIEAVKNGNWKQYRHCRFYFGETVTAHRALFTGVSKPCTPSLAAAIGTTACIAAAVPSIATITRGT